MRRAEQWAAYRRAGSQALQAMTAERYDVIAALTRAGFTAAQISERLKVNQRTVQRARVRTGVAKPFCGTPFSDEEARRAAEMLDDGASYMEVARTLNRVPSTIRRHLPGRSVWKSGSSGGFRGCYMALDAIKAPVGWTPSDEAVAS